MFASQEGFFPGEWVSAACSIHYQKSANFYCTSIKASFLDHTFCTTWVHHHSSYHLVTSYTCWY